MSAHLGLVVHVQQGDGSLAGFFDNPSAQVSAHFWCSKSGRLEQYLDTDVVAWAEENGNGSYVSCEFEGFDTEAMTSLQLLVGAGLFKWLAGLYGFPITGPVAHGQKGLTPHCNLDGSPDPAWGDHPCPGTIRLGQMGGIVYLASPTPSPSPTPITGGSSMTCDVPGGGVLVARPDGSVDAFEGAGFFGSLPGLKATPSAPIVGICATATGKGYWLVGADAMVYAFGDAPWYGPVAKYPAEWSLGLGRPIPVVGIVRGTAAGAAYTIVGDELSGAAASLYGITTDGRYKS